MTFIANFCLALILSTAVAARDSSWPLRAREEALARALNAKDAAVLAKLVNQNFHISWTMGSAVSNFSGAADRETWMRNVLHLRIVSYEAVISGFSMNRPDQAFIELDESWTLRSPQGRQIEQRFHVTDSWMKESGTWKLMGRSCRAPLPSDPYLR